MSKKIKRYLLKVKIRKVTGTAWYKVGEVHEVQPEVNLHFKEDNVPFFNKRKGFYGIRCSDCNIIGETPLPINLTPSK